MEGLYSYNRAINSKSSIKSDKSILYHYQPT